MRKSCVRKSSENVGHYFQNMFEQMYETADDVAQGMTLSALDLALARIAIEHTCGLKNLGDEPVMEELRLNNCLLEDHSIV